MNRRERRSLEKKWGISAYRKKLPIEKRMEITRKNIEEAKIRILNMQEEARIRRKQEEDSDINNKISLLASDLMLSEGLDYYSAIQKAKEEYGA